MKIKVFLTIFFSFILILSIGGLGRVVGEQLKEKASLSIVERALDEDAKGKTKAELLGIIGAHKEEFMAANKEVSQEYSWYFILNLAVQAIIFISIAMVTTKIVTIQTRCDGEL